MQQQQIGMSRQAHDHVASRPDTVADTPPSVDDTPTFDRSRYTMTVEGVAALLHTNSLDRDSRTIQRWCKSGKIDAVIDASNGERWLIDPATVQPVIDGILAEMSRRPQALSPTPSQVPRHDPTPAASATDNPPSEPILKGDTSRDGQPSVADTPPASDDVGDSVAALKKRVGELEIENAKLSGAIQVRDQMVDYMKEQFQTVLDDTFDRAERIGKLEAENAHLRATLPEPAREREKADHLGSYEPTSMGSQEIGGV